MKNSILVNIGYFIAACLSLMLVSCVSESEDDVSGTIGNGEMRVCLRLATPNDGSPVTRGQLAGTEPDYVSELWMLCFDRYGIFVGKRKATITPITANRPGLDHGAFTGQVPEVTARIHFVANYEPKIGDAEVQQREEVLMLSEKMASAYSDETNTGCIYWGYVHKNTPSEMKDWIAGQPVTNGEEVTYTPENTVYLVRDRAKVVIEGIAANADIKALEWTISNGRSKGYIAALDHSKMGTSQNPFDGYYAEITQASSGHGPTPGHSIYEGVSPINEYNLDNERFTAVENDLAEWNSESSAQYLYEDKNKQENPIRLIFHVTYNDDTEKYHVVLLADNDQKQIEVLRNRVYWLTIIALPKDMGVGTFAEALTTTNYTNNQMVSVGETIAKVSNGKAELEVNNGNTTILFTERPNDGYVYIPFTFINPKATNSNEKGVLYDVIGADGTITTSDVHYAASDFSVKWNEDATDLGLYVDETGMPQITYNWNTGIGSIKFKADEITGDMKHGELLLTDSKYGMQRKIQVYTITSFKLAATPLLTKVDGVIHQVGNSSIHLYTCDTWKLDLKLPADFPAGLFPITLEMATSTLNPFSDSSPTDPSGAYSVTVKSTEMLNSSNNQTSWFYHAKSGATWSGWGFWYEYTLSQRPEGVAGNMPIPITIYFNDIRPTRLETANISNVGLYLRMKYFTDSNNNEIITIEGTNS